MKAIIPFVFLLFISAMAVPSFAQKKVQEDSIKVAGNCAMCKKRIESALDKNGIKHVNWDIDKKVLFVAYRNDKITREELHKLIAETGHDTDQVQAADSVYAKLPFCCLYRDHDPHDEKSRHDH